jgi:hypothetical protein
VAAKPAAAPVNPARGEAEIVLEGTTFGLRPSYEAVVAIEEATGLALGVLASAAATLRLPLAKLALVVTELIKAWGRSTETRSATLVNPDRIGALIHDAGVLHGAATGGYYASGEARPATTTTGTTTAP